MNLLFNVTSTVIVIGAGSYLLFKLYYKEKEYTKIEVVNIPTPESKVIFFTNANVNCRRYCLSRKKRRPCGSNCSLEKLKYITKLIDNAQETLDVCIYLITCNELTYAIIRAYNRGINIRIIVDEEMSTCSESKVGRFIKAGIPVKAKKTNSLMHHKFCIIDSGLPERKLLTGSLNWTLQGLAGNFEYVTIISHLVPVLDYQIEFNLLWNEFSLKN